jgi:prepilin-type N-terminal cleavage/methylation domain-containing protein
MMKKGFTLIELLIVVAIIAILAAIAVPNFLEAQTRAKISRVKADLRTIATGVESYLVDHNIYPSNWSNVAAWDLVGITTPIAYLTSIPSRDPFIDLGLEHPIFENGVPTGNQVGSYLYVAMFTIGDRDDHNTWAEWVGPGSGWQWLRMGYILESWGPDRMHGDTAWSVWWDLDWPVPTRPYAGIDSIYDPTNGTNSTGDVSRYGGETPPFHGGAEIVKLING